MSNLRYLLLLVACMSLPSQAFGKAIDTCIPSLYGLVNMTTNISNEQDTIGQSQELGATLFCRHFGPEVFTKRIQLVERHYTSEGLRDSDLRFNDQLTGGGMRIWAGWFSLKAGVVDHKIVSKQLVQGATNNLPNGSALGIYSGGGLFIILPRNLDFQVDYTNYSLATGQAHIPQYWELAVGIRIDWDVLAPPARPKICMRCIASPFDVDPQ